MNELDRLTRMDEKLDELFDAFNKHALESVEVRVHVDMLKNIVYGAVGLSLTSIMVAAFALLVR